MTETLKVIIRENLILIMLLFIAMMIFLTQTILYQINPKQEMSPQKNLTEECNKTCQNKGLVLSVIDRAGIGYTAHETEGRCICFNTSTINNT